MLSAIGGLGVAGLFSDKLNPPDEEGNIDYGSGIGIQNVGKAANLLDHSTRYGSRFKIFTRTFYKEIFTQK